MKLVKPIQIDINSGYNVVVGPEVNKVLIELQEAGNTVDKIEQQGVDGRKCYVMITYDTPK